MVSTSLTTDLNRRIGRRIMELRENRQPGKLTQQGLASLTKGALSRSTIANIEAGHQGISITQLFVLADALDVDPAALLPPREAVLPRATETSSEALGAHPAPIRLWLQRVRSSAGPKQGEKDA